MITDDQYGKTVEGFEQKQVKTVRLLNCCEMELLPSMPQRKESGSKPVMKSNSRL
jgi:hypothetical protein